MSESAVCPQGGTLADGTTTEVLLGVGAFVRNCTCGFASTGPAAPEEYARHLLGLV